MWSIFTDVATNAGLDFEYLILLIVVIGCMIFMAKSFQLGLIMMFILNGGLFMWFWTDGALNWVYPLLVMLMSLVMLSLSLYVSHKFSSARGVI